MKQKFLPFLNRNLSTLNFNQRVLFLAQREDFPLLERLRLLCIVASNLDEFFEVRMPAQLDGAIRGGSKSEVNIETFTETSIKVQELVAEQYRIFNEELMPALEVQGVFLLSNNVRTLEQKHWVAQFFKRSVMPLLVPVVLDLAHPFPQVANKSLHFIIELEKNKHKDSSDDQKTTIAIIRVPRSLARLTKLPKSLSGGNQCFVSLTSIIRANLDILFTGKKIINYSQFRVTRDSELEVDEDDAGNLRTALRKELAYRQYGEAIRLEVSHTCPEHLTSFLLKQFSLPELALYRVHGPVNLGRLIQLPDLVSNTALKYPSFQAKWPNEMAQKKSIFAQLKVKDILIHRPFETFDAVLQLLQEAAEDPHVVAIHQTIYRAGSDSRMLQLLKEAVRRGKEVVVVVELKARFDEEANISWADELESIGAQVVYGVVGLKTHAKMLLIMRREGKLIKRYGHLSTGNYNRNTARLYTDICMMTGNADITREMMYVFRYLTSQQSLPRMRQLLVAPFYLQNAMLKQIQSAGVVAARGKPVRIIAKMNALTDEVLVMAIMDAAAKGAQFDLIIRGACILPVDSPALGGRVRVRSIVGRFLEHSRVFYFEIDQKKTMWLASADWMSRNMLRRVEVAWPIRDAKMKQRIIDECLNPYLQDNLDAWTLSAEGQYLKVESTFKADKQISAQNKLMKIFNKKPT